MPEYSSNYTSGYVRGGINRYRRGNVAAKVAGAAGVALAGYGLFKGAQALVRVIRNKHALNLKARGIVEDSGLPQTRLQRRIVKSRLKGNEAKERKLQLKSDERTNKLTSRAISQHDKDTERAAKKYMRKQRWENFRQDWRDSMDANREELSTGIDKLNIIGNIRDKAHERQRASGKYEGMTKKQYKKLTKELEIQEMISDADKIIKEQKQKSKRF